jgi:hypothetical protein
VKENFVPIKTYLNEYAAYIAKSALEAYEIESIILKDDCGGTRPHLQLTTGIQLLVRKEDVERAKEIIESNL